MGRECAKEGGSGKRNRQHLTPQNRQLRGEIDRESMNKSSFEGTHAIERGVCEVKGDNQCFWEQFCTAIIFVPEKDFLVCHFKITESSWNSVRLSADVRDRQSIS